MQPLEIANNKSIPIVFTLFRQFSDSFACHSLVAARVCPFPLVFALFGLSVSDLFWPSVSALSRTIRLLPFSGCQLDPPETPFPSSFEWPGLRWANRQLLNASVQQINADAVNSCESCRTFRNSTWDEYYMYERQSHYSNRNTTKARPMRTNFCSLGGDMATNERK